jgi:hypothetical protein
VRRPERIDASGRATVITGSSRPQVTTTESTPVSGVETRKALTAPLLAPAFRRDAATGSTEQEQSGSGAPTTEAVATERRSSRDIQRLSHSELSHWATKPATRNPSSR